MSSTALKISTALSHHNLEEYQHRAADFVINTPFSALWVDCGLGKTASTLAAVADIFRVFMCNKPLVVAPKKVAIETWPTEVAKWDGLFYNDVRVSVIVGNPKQRMKAATTDADIYVINVENLVWLIDTFFNSWSWDWLIMDESSLFKDHSTKRFKKLKRVIGQFSRVTQLTGTPASNGLMNLWSQIYLLDKGERLGRTITEFRNRYFNATRRGDFTTFEIKPGAEQEIYDAVKDLVFRLDGDDYLKMEPLKMIPHIITPSDETREFYKKFATELIHEIEDEKVIAAVNKAVLTNKLLQITSGAMYVDDMNVANTDEVLHIHDDKLDKLEEIVEGTGSPILVAYNFKSDLKRLQERFPYAVNVKEVGAVERWNRGEIKMLLAHPASAGHGLNLQDGGHVMVWFALNWSLELFIQFNARLRRKGQKFPVLCHLLIMENTVDEQVLSALQGKEITQNELLNAMKAQVSA